MAQASTSTTEDAQTAQLKALAIRDLVRLSAIESARELSATAARLADAMEDGGLTVGLMMETDLLNTAMQTQWAQARVLGRVLDITDNAGEAAQQEARN